MTTLWVPLEDFDELKKRVTSLEESLRYLLIEAEEEEEDPFEVSHQIFASKVSQMRERK